MRFDLESTVCSIATGTLNAYRGAIRVSGSRATSIVSHALQSTHRIEWNSRRSIRFETTADLDVLGTVDIAVFLWPDHRSYTGQPTVELHCVGNVIVLQSLQELLISHGARLAEPGEFTLRSFLAGKLDLTQCEAVLGVIHAANDRALSVALNQLAGGLSQPLKQLQTSLIHLVADIEAGLDFVDEDILFISQSEIQNRLRVAIESIDLLRSQMESRGDQTSEFTVAVIGPPNAGKSSLINALAQQELSIVSDQPGTTRDYIRFRISVQGVVVDLIDTAGIESVDEPSPRKLAQGMTEEQMRDADLVLFCLPNTESTKIDDTTLTQLPTNTWLIRTKSDLVNNLTLQTHFKQVNTSIRDPGSMTALRGELLSWALQQKEAVHQVVPSTAVRCNVSLSDAMCALHEALEASQQARGDEVIASEIRIALDELGHVTGTVYTEDILDALFSRFCIGK